MTRLTEIARAKVNLTLGVRGRRPDGFHDLASLVAFADVGDVLSLDANGREGVTVLGPFAPTLSGENLVALALARARERAPELTTGHVTLDKRLPIAAGIGGGSADAGAVLRLLRRLNPASEANWRAIAGRLGADVPVCFENRAAFMTGTGDSLVHCNELPPLHTVLVNPLVPVPDDKTAQVFRRLSAPMLPAGRPDAKPPGPFATAAQLIGYMARHGNDLEPPARALVPAIADVLAALDQSAGCRMSRLSGGGPTCFGLYDTAHGAEAAALSISRAHPSWWVAATVLG